jgi:Integrase zinc binding domain
MDHDSLKYMNMVQKPSKRLARWIDEFQQYNLIIKYRPGSQAIVPDAISRRPDFSLNALIIQNAEEYVPYIRQFLQDHSISEDASDSNRAQIIAEAAKFVLKDGVLHRKVKEGEGITAPYIDFQFRRDLMQKMHDQYGHLSLQGLANVLESRAWWPTMERDLSRYIAACPNCQIQQRQRISQEREEMQVVTDQFIQPFQRWGIDLIGRLPKTTNGNRWIIAAIDYATGWPIAKAIPAATKEAIAEFIHDEIYLHYGAPQEIFTDGGKNLWGGVVERYLEKIKTVHKGTSPYHPCMNGKVERLNGIIGNMLGKMLLNKLTKLWDLYLDQAVFACHI